MFRRASARWDAFCAGDSRAQEAPIVEIDGEAGVDYRLHR
jgi:hypothetical protein